MCGLISASCQIIVVLLLVSVPLVDEAALEACAGFLMWGADACPLVGGTVSWSSGGQGCVKRHVKRQLGTQEVFMVSVCRWVGLCSCSIGCLAWDVAALESIGYWVRQGFGDQLLASRRSHADRNSLISLPPESLSLERATVVPHLRRRPSRARGQFWPGFYEVRAFALGPSAYEALCGPTKNGVSVLSSSVELLQSSPAGLQS